MPKFNVKSILVLIALLVSMEQVASFLPGCPTNKPVIMSTFDNTKTSRMYQPNKLPTASLSTINRRYDSIVQINMSNNSADPSGQRRGLILFPLVLLFTVWLFTIPPEFRRAHICSEQQVIDYPGKCITPDTWINGVKEYYRNGGGIEFDFSIDPGTK